MPINVLPTLSFDHAIDIGQDLVAMPVVAPADILERLEVARSAANVPPSHQPFVDAAVAEASRHIVACVVRQYIITEPIQYLQQVRDLRKYIRGMAIGDLTNVR